MQQKVTISLGVENLLKKGAVQQVCPQKDQFLSNIFIVKKKHGGNRPVIILKELNKYNLSYISKWRVYSRRRLSHKKKRVHMQTRPQGHIFMCTTFSDRERK